MKRPDRGQFIHLPAAKERLASFISSQGLKATRPREIILEALFSVPGHLSIDELVDRAHSRDPSIGAATVYRTMKILTEAGLASVRHFEGKETRYEAALHRHHHDHLICDSCGNIIEFENERIEELQDRVARDHGFVVTHHKLELYGLCKSCRERRPRP